MRHLQQLFWSFLSTAFSRQTPAPILMPMPLLTVREGLTMPCAGRIVELCAIYTEMQEAPDSLRETPRAWVYILCRTGYKTDLRRILFLRGVFHDDFSPTGTGCVLPAMNNSLLPRNGLKRRAWEILNSLQLFCVLCLFYSSAFFLQLLATERNWSFP